METKQTAVDWLMNELTKERKFHINNAILSIFKNSLQERKINELINQAKAMEKEQIKNAYYDGTKQFANDARIDYPLTFNDYYNETYGK